MITYLKKRLGKFVSRKLPPITKKMLLISSMVNLLIYDQETQERLLVELNEAFQLAREKGSMNFGLAVGRIMWKDLQNRMDYTHASIQEIAKEILDSCPDSLKYDKPEVIERDLVDAIKFIRKHQYV